MESFGTEFWLALLQIIGINIILSGDNAVVIALACRNLPPKQQKWGIILGAGAAVVLRVIFTIFVVYLMTVPYLKFFGGVLLFWIGYKLMVQQDESDHVDAGGTLFAAVRIILIADAVMSLDNVIAVAAAAKGSIVLLVLGLLISVPLVVYGATLLINLIKRYPVIVPGGAALIGYIGGEVVITDLAFEPWIAANAPWMHAVVPLAGAIAVVMIGRIVAPGPAPTFRQVTGEAVGAAALAGFRLVLQIAGRLLVARAPLIVAFFVSLFGYSVGHNLLGVGESIDTARSVLHSVQPVFAAAIAIVFGEVTAWAVRRLRAPSESHDSAVG
ncbi:MAG: YjbE family putative metal transport protein [Alphaproteobacteria bacterium]|nr:YjbE family putative metal transport protein [Alphaproteobacteria bacterium]